MIHVENLEIRQGNFHLRNISFEIPSGSYGILMGKTGCGKSSILEAIAGLRRILRGRIVLQDQDVTELHPSQRGIGYVPQDGALFRTMTVRQHLGFALEIRATNPGMIQNRVQELADWLKLSHLLERYPKGLSGGEIQRVAIGRALSACPSVLLMDEPFSSLDEDTRDELIDLLKEIRQQNRVTILHITHSRYEAERLGDVVMRLEKGSIQNELSRSEK